MSHLRSFILLLAIAAASVVTATEISGGRNNHFEPLPLKWRPFNMHKSDNIIGSENEVSFEEEQLNAVAFPHNVATAGGMQLLLPRSPTSPIKVGEVKSFVEGLKSRIKTEISLLLALTDVEEENATQGEQEGAAAAAAAPGLDTMGGGGNSGRQLRDLFAGDNSRLRKFIPLPLLRRSRHS